MRVGTINPHHRRRPLFPTLILLAGLLFFSRGIPAPEGAADTPASSPTPAAAQSSSEWTSSPEAGSDAVHASPAHEHEQQLSRVMIALVILLLAAKLGGELVERVGQPAVLGELAFGMIIGNLHLVGIHGLEFLKSDVVLSILAEVGVILLLFEVGLESNIREMAAVGVSSFLAACVGVVTPFFLGWATAAYFWSDLEMLAPPSMREALAPYAKYVQIFIGGVLCATSVGITARVLKDMGKLQLRESRIILGAAVIDDVLGLIVLAVCVGIVTAASGGQTFGAMDVGWIIAKATVFFVGMAAVGPILAKPIFRVAAQFRVRGILLTTPLLICFLASYAASKIGLAPIVGAFAAGLILENAHFQVMPEHKERRLEDLITPLTTFLAPIFFVRMGIMVDISAFGNASILGFALVLTAAAIIGKQACSLGVIERKLDRLAVGLGMIPRGEVGLIFANEGTKLMLNGYPLVDRNVLSAVVIMVIITTLVTPPLLKWKLSRGSERKT